MIELKMSIGSSWLSKGNEIRILGRSQSIVTIMEKDIEDNE